MSTQTSESKLKALRALLRTETIDYYLLPLLDEYGFEYVPNHHKRLEWLTDFTGSNAYAVIGLEKAAIFTDGRYRLQIRGEVSTDCYEIYDFSEMTPHAWLSKNAPKGSIIGFDPRIMNMAEKAAYEKLCLDRAFTLKALTSNPIDAVWQDRPAATSFTCHEHNIQFAGESVRSKCDRLALKIEAQKCDALFITESDTVSWLLNIRANDVPNTPLLLSFALITKDAKVTLFVEKAKMTESLTKALPDFVTIQSLESIAEYLRTHHKAFARTLADKAHLSVYMADLFQKNQIEWIVGSDPAEILKLCKNATEIKGTEMAHLWDAVSVCRAWKWLEDTIIIQQNNVHEYQVVKKLHEIRSLNPQFKDNSFDTISGSGPNGAIIHYRVSPDSSRPLNRDSMFLLDSGGQYYEGTTDITRVFTFKPAHVTAEMKKHYTLVLKGTIALSQAVFPAGTFGENLDTLARQALWAHGLDYAHGTGHGVGSYLSVHEGSARIAKRSSTTPLQPGMILSNEPGFYLEGAYGIRLENLIYVAPHGTLPGYYHFKTLTHVPFEAALIDASLLTPSDKDWLKTYHAAILEKVIPHCGADNGLIDFIHQKAAPFIKSTF
ncbi:MAG: aminopeptidase P family protein [Alphaproteobacteria bacterium]|nr:aminopeptidase P family protein [Alphaproteobacteria bacterium]MBP9878138.1 aminopeptidase P family protein [Alphaproteobacteria bacterium]